ncbi:AbrB/MazE/SpoVT family DNA-binding domain-containing protein [Stygiolobus caldivivus]|uniref:SpoVT-AbrB domain-containing protein n=1 Tax=Stygiolobus caldivivus TaxID=2824673 RepID=A0A8D5ZEK7_9CREN|nr:AbrB/MazE/SpoVT family DNA-binding domain-containing protein [Stygiolobus caldivivus]BCU69733.1 hypothetical protein KN1_10300 [Stygiolobus caldivivus]
MVIPKEARQRLMIKEGDILELVVDVEKVSTEELKTLLDLFGVDGEGVAEMTKQLIEDKELKER